MFLPKLILLSNCSNYPFNMDTYMDTYICYKVGAGITRRTVLWDIHEKSYNDHPTFTYPTRALIFFLLKCLKLILHDKQNVNVFIYETFFVKWTLLVMSMRKQWTNKVMSEAVNHVRLREAVWLYNVPVETLRRRVQDLLRWDENLVQTQFWLT